MRRVFIIHGWGGSPKEPMHKWMKANLEKNGFEVITPEMPNAAEPKIKEWIGKLKEVVQNPDEETFFIGHSIGCQGVLRYIETINPKIKIWGIVLIAPWMHLNEETIKEEGEEVIEIAKPWIETPINWEKIKLHTNKFVCIFSDNDPYVPLSEKELFQEKLGAKIIVEHNKGHFTESDNIKENPTVLNELLRITKE